MRKSQAAKTENASRQATYQDVLDVPPHMVAEIVDGTLYTNPRPAYPHAGVAAELMCFIGPPFRQGRGGPGGWWIFCEPELHLGKEIVVPDLAGWRRERMPEHPLSAYVTLAPDWVCEVLSPSTRNLDLGRKRGIYARAGVGHLWLADPLARLLETFELRGTEWVLIDSLHDDATVSLPPFEAISFNLGRVWPPRTVHKELPGGPPVESERELTGTSAST